MSTRHYDKAPVIETRNGSCTLCPHCGKRLVEADIYTDKKGWSFCRACFRQGRGAIRIDKPFEPSLDPSVTKKAATFLFEYMLPIETDEFTLEKDAQRIQINTPRQVTAGTPGNRTQRAITTDALARGDSQGPPTFVPDSDGSAESGLSHVGTLARNLGIAVPLGAAGFAFADQDEEDENPVTSAALRGVGTGIGGALGATAGSAFGKGDVGTSLGGGVAGSLLGYLLSRKLQEKS